MRLTTSSSAIRHLLAGGTPESGFMASRPNPYRCGRYRSNRGFGDRPGEPAPVESHSRTLPDSNSGYVVSRNASYSFQPRQFNPRPSPPPQFNHQNFNHRQPAPSFQQNQFQYAIPGFNYNNANHSYQGTAHYQQHQFLARPGFVSHNSYGHQVQPVHQNQQRAQQYQPRPSSSKPLDFRDWEFAKTQPPPQREQFTILSYNILADYLANNHWRKLYVHIPRHMLNWESRKRSLFFELQLWSADIMCLQEVDRFQELEEEFRHRGYMGIYKMRTGIPVDGCSVFWRTSKFKLLHEESIEFNEFGLRDNVAQLCVLESLQQRQIKNPSASQTRVVICNIHVLFNPKRGEMKLGQVRILLEKAHIISKIWNDAPVVLCGDFNCTPKSPLYNFISEQQLDLSELARDEVSGQVSAEFQLSRFYRPNPGAQFAVNTGLNKIEKDVPSGAAERIHLQSQPQCDGIKPTLIDEPLAAASNGAEMDSFTVDVESIEEPLDSDYNQFETMKPTGIDQSEDSPPESEPSSPEAAYNPSRWSSMELETATGKADCSSLEHPLKLNSTYTETEDLYGTRDASGEPQITSYHRCFCGTLDYIWRSEGLQTVKVRAPMRKQAMQWTRGFPTKKWGSDHIALVAQLAFVEGPVGQARADE